MNKKQFLSALLVWFTLNSYAQSTAPRVIASAGGDGISATHQLSWTIGEPIITTETSTNQVLTQGFHQTQLILNSITQLQSFIRVNAFPNPTSQNITIETPSSSYTGFLSLQLLDITGKQIKETLVFPSNSTQQIDMTSYPSGVYFIHIKDDVENKISNIKIIKK